MTHFYIGLMSGTSLDGVDGVLVDFTEVNNIATTTVKSHKNYAILAHASINMPAPLRQILLELNTTGHNELHRAALASNALVGLYAQVVRQLLNDSKLSNNCISAIGAHGQTVRHRPQEFDGTGYTIQLNQPALLAEYTGIDVVADFRSRDVAAGGQGAPLVPAFHADWFTCVNINDNLENNGICVLNIGGIANLTVLASSQKSQIDTLGFDCGPGNALMDAWCHQHTQNWFDNNGDWAKSGTVLPNLLAAFLSDSFFRLTPPKSTGRDLFNVAWMQHIVGMHTSLSTNPADVQATLTELTAASCADAVLQFGGNAKLLVVCGGGALNRHLIARLGFHLPSMRVSSSSDFGLHPLQVEACAFAWLARQTVQRKTANLPQVTGANSARILGAIYPS